MTNSQNYRRQRRSCSSFVLRKSSQESGQELKESSQESNQESSRDSSQDPKQSQEAPAGDSHGRASIGRSATRWRESLSRLTRGVRNENNILHLSGGE